MTRTKLAAQTRNSSIEHGALIAAALAIGCSWPLWIFERLAVSYPQGAWRGHWLSLVTALLFASASGCMLLACFSRKNSFIILASRFAAATIPLALLLLAFAVVYSDLQPEAKHFWFIGFSGIPAVSLALTVKKKIAVPCFFLTVGCSMLGKMWAVGWNPWYEVIGELGFALVYSFPFIVFSNTALSIARILDQTETQTRKNLAVVAKLRTRAEEKTRFSALIHDRVLADLSAISRGITPSGTLDQLLGGHLYFSKGSDTAEQSLQDVLREVINKLDPKCTVLLHDDTKLPVPGFPEEAIGSIVPALTEALRNSLKHAGKEATRRCEIWITPQKIKIILADNGCGFDVEKVPPVRAGIPVSILGRMNSVKGCTAAVESQPGLGTKVTLSWTSTEDEHSHAPDVLEDSPQHNIYNLLGMKIVFSWWFGITIFCIFADITLLASPKLGIVDVVITLVFLLGIVLIIPGRYEKLPLQKTYALVVLLTTLALLAIHQPIMQQPEAWNSFTTFNGFVLLTALLAIRGRPLASWIIVFTSALLIEILFWLGLNPASYVRFWAVLAVALLVIPSTLVHFGLRYFFQRFPMARQAQLEAERTAASTAELEARRKSNLTWLEQEVFPVFATAQLLDEPTPQLKKRAHLTELKVRDTLRSPLLDRPTLNASVWDARARGVTVRLIDDYSNYETFPNTPDPPDPNLPHYLDQLLRRAIPTLDLAAENTEITIRLFPPNRSTFATIVSESGIERILKADSKPARKEP